MKSFPKYVEVGGNGFYQLEENHLVEFYNCPKLNLNVRLRRDFNGKLEVNNLYEPMFQGLPARVISERKFKKLNKDFI